MASRTRKSRDIYIDRMHRVTEHIDRHIDQYLDLETLAEVAHFSPFHFHRLFSAWMGETLGGYLRRRRCELASTRLLAQPKLGILEIALDVGFGSSPTTWRLQQSQARQTKSKLDQTSSKMDQAPRLEPRKNESPNSTAERFMKVEIVDRTPTTIAYLRYVGPYGRPVGTFWQTEVYPW